MRVEAAPTTTGRVSTARWSGSGKQDGKVYVRNQRLNAPQESHQLESGGYGLGSSAHLRGNVRGTPRPVDVAGREATVKACGVVVAMLQGHSWAPTPSSGSRVNVGTILDAPSPADSQSVGGKARRRPTPPGWDGGPVVVRGRESRSHGEGVQRDRSINAAARSPLVNIGDPWPDLDEAESRVLAMQTKLHQWAIGRSWPPLR